jgi:hypothetical protein
MKSKLAYSGLAAAALLALTQPVAAQGTSGGTGAIASIPGSVVRDHEQGSGLVSIITGSTLPNSNLDRKRRTALPARSWGAAQAEDRQMIRYLFCRC